MRRKVFVNRSAWVPLGHWRRSSAPHLIQAFLNQGPDPHVMLLVVGIDLAIGSIDILDDLEWRLAGARQILRGNHNANGGFLTLG